MKLLVKNLLQGKTGHKMTKEDMIKELSEEYVIIDRTLPYVCIIEEDGDTRQEMGSIDPIQALGVLRVLEQEILDGIREKREGNG